MNLFENEAKAILKKINQKKEESQDIKKLMTMCDERLSDFHLYSLGLKYYSYLERNLDFEEDDFDVFEEEHVHDENCNHDHEEHVHDENCNHDHEEHVHDENCDHDHGIHSESLSLIKVTFDDYIRHFAKTGELPSVNELLDLRQGLKDHVSVLTAYGDQISLLENVYYKSRYNDEAMIAMDSDEAFAQRVAEFLMDNEDSTEIREHLKYIYPELPMRMAKNKFFGFVDDYFLMLKGIPTEDVKNHIQVLKESFDPTCVTGYGELVSEIALELDKVQEVFINGDKGEKDSAYHYLYHLTTDKNELLELGLDIAEQLNHLLALVLCKQDYVGSHVFDVMKPLLEGELSEDMLVDVFEDVERNYEPLGEDLITISTIIDRLSQDETLVEQFDIHFKTNELAYAYELSKEGYFIDRPFKKDETVPSVSELAFIKNELLGYMEHVLGNDQRAMKRGRMSLMMGILQIVHSSGQQIYDHILQSITSCDNKGEKVMSMQNIYSYINDFID